METENESVVARVWGWGEGEEVEHRGLLEKILCTIPHWWVHVKSIAHTTPRTNLPVNYRLRVTTTCPCTVILGDECYIWWGVSVMGEEAKLVGGRGCMGYLCTILSIF